MKKGQKSPPLLEIKMSIEVGDQVIHPQHGLGRVSALTVKQFVEGEKRLFYEIAFSGSTLWVPVDLTTSGIRKLSAKREIIGCRQLLKSPAKPVNDDSRLRQTELNDHLKVGTLTARCEVVRNLTAYGWHKPLNRSTADFLQTALDILCQEWAAVEEITPEEAATEIQTLLDKGKQANDNN